MRNPPKLSVARGRALDYLAHSLCGTCREGFWEGLPGRLGDYFLRRRLRRILAEMRAGARIGRLS